MSPATYTVAYLKISLYKLSKKFFALYFLTILFSIFLSALITCADTFRVNIININVMIIKRKELVFLNVNYYLPDYKNIIQEFVWQTKDVTPELPRVHKFLNFWHHNIEAVISEVFVTYGDKHDIRVTDFIRELE